MLAVGLEPCSSFASDAVTPRRQACAAAASDSHAAVHHPAIIIGLRARGGFGRFFTAVGEIAQIRDGHFRIGVAVRRRLRQHVLVAVDQERLLGIAVGDPGDRVVGSVEGNRAVGIESLARGGGLGPERARQEGIILEQGLGEGRAHGLGLFRSSKTELPMQPESGKAAQMPRKAAKRGLDDDATTRPMRFSWKGAIRPRGRHIPETVSLYSPWL